MSLFCVCGIGFFHAQLTEMYAGGKMLQIKDLTITHLKDLRIILDKFNMVLNDGDKAVIIASFPGAVISISHDRKYIDEVCTKTYILTEEGLK